MEIQFSLRKAVLWGAVIQLIQMSYGNFLYTNPFVSKIFRSYEGHPAIKSVEFIGGMKNWVLMNMVFGILLLVFWIILYRVLYTAIPGVGVIKGLLFGLGLGLIKAVPEAFNQWMLINYPVPLIFVQLVNTLVTLIIFGALLGFFFHKFGVIIVVQD